MENHQPNNDVHDRLPFLAKYTGYIIGKGGKGIQSLKMRSGVTKLWVDNNNSEHFRENWSYLHMIGHPMNNDAAKCLLMQRIRDAEVNRCQNSQ